MLVVGESYSKETLYSILQVPTEKQRGPWNTGYVKYNNGIYLFANIGIPGRTGHDYNNTWEGPHLVWYAKTASHIGQQLMQEMINNTTPVYIFTREADRAPFIYHGIGQSIAYEDTRPVKITWRIIAAAQQTSATSFIDTEKSWALFLANAQKALLDQHTFTTAQQTATYRVVNVTATQVQIVNAATLSRHSSPIPITYKDFQQVITTIQTNTGKRRKNNNNRQEAIEAAIVWLIPTLDWDDALRPVIDKVDNNDPSNTTMLTVEAQDDQTVTLVTTLKRLRRGQNKLRNFLLQQYDGKCCITGCDVKEVLNACHIEPHAVKGLNNSQNALLLRSDIHDLWDVHLIGIHPQTLEIHIKDVLKNTAYASLAKKQLAIRRDQQNPDPAALTARWHLFAPKTSS
ncbi:HNH endonuclease [Chitinophaga nivalis]|uniref:HNH endonuclease n=1 Tax=Chitinophaga nivalis TaxID=2991709 RepID=A0ABT3IH14_9BACT|nr:HNH endonuclease signature motif containing protein [Chitinophaga nivalis]MCW3467052.1 HNH endonuclease [Chitinophaga nivalis]MCW3483257.1 HNH endonuclease [Chitinophaga nivalis]